jgi:serine/threonine protein kinase
MEESDNRKSFYEKRDDVFLSYFDEEGPNMDEYSLADELAGIEVHYEKVELIDQGGMKQVYRMIDKKTDRSVAMAVLKKQSEEDEVEQFLREARLTSKLQHPNIIAVYDMGFNRHDLPYFTMELLKGQTLAQIIKEKNKGEQTYLQSFSQSQLIDVFLKMGLVNFRAVFL